MKGGGGMVQGLSSLGVWKPHCSKPYVVAKQGS